jgi:hypothetical protein
VPGNAYSWAYKQARAEFLARLRREGQFGVCFRCSGPVDLGLSGNRPDGPTVDHAAPLALGGELLDESGFQLAHRRCNLSAGATLGNRMRGRARNNGSPSSMTVTLPPDTAHHLTHSIIGGQCVDLDGRPCTTCPPPSRIW